MSERQKSTKKNVKKKEDTALTEKEERQIQHRAKTTKQGKSAWSTAGSVYAGGKAGLAVAGPAGAVVGGLVGYGASNIADKAGDPETMRETMRREKQSKADEEARRNAEQEMINTRRKANGKPPIKDWGREKAELSQTPSPQRNSQEQRNAERGRPTIHIPD